LSCFRKVESELSSKWTVGKVTEVFKRRDEIVRRATVKYQNSSEKEPRYTDRAARSFMEGGLERKVGVQHKQQTLRKTSKVEVYKTMQYMLLPFPL